MREFHPAWINNQVKGQDIPLTQWSTVEHLISTQTKCLSLNLKDGPPTVQWPLHWRWSVLSATTALHVLQHLVFLPENYRLSAVNLMKFLDFSHAALFFLTASRCPVMGCQQLIWGVTGSVIFGLGWKVYSVLLGDSPCLWWSCSLLECCRDWAWGCLEMSWRNSLFLTIP